MAIVANGNFNNPALGQAFSSIASMFAPPTLSEQVQGAAIQQAQATAQQNQAAAAAKTSALSDLAKLYPGVPVADLAAAGFADPAKTAAQFKQLSLATSGAPMIAGDGFKNVYSPYGDTVSAEASKPIGAEQVKFTPAGVLGANPVTQYGPMKNGDRTTLFPNGQMPSMIGAAAPADAGDDPAPLPALPAGKGQPDPNAPLLAALGLGAPTKAVDNGVTTAPNGITTISAPDKADSVDAQKAAIIASMDDNQKLHWLLTQNDKPLVDISNKGEGAEAAAAGTDAAKRRSDMLAAADAAPDKIARLNLLGTVLGRTQTGPLAGLQGNVVNVANSLGISPDTIKGLGLDPNQAVDNQIAQKLANELVMGSIGAKNGGFPASNFSVAERQFIEKTFPNIAAQPGANQAVNDVLVAREQRNIQKGDAWAAYKQQQNGQPLSYENFEDQWQRQHSGDNIFAPIQQKLTDGGYGPVGAAPPAMLPTNAAAPGGAVPAAQPGSAAPSAPIAIHSVEDYNALPRGALFLAPGEAQPRTKQ